MIKENLSELRLQRKLLSFLMALLCLSAAYVGYSEHTVEAFRIFTTSLEVIVGLYMAGNVGSAYVNKGQPPTNGGQ